MQHTKSYIDHTAARKTERREETPGKTHQDKRQHVFHAKQLSKLDMHCIVTAMILLLDRDG